jgi:hypothetical protein
VFLEVGGAITLLHTIVIQLRRILDRRLHRKYFIIT